MEVTTARPEPDTTTETVKNTGTGKGDGKKGERGWNLECFNNTLIDMQ